MQSVLAFLRSFTANSDPLAALASTVALVVVSNQPFYPLYIHWIAGVSAWPAWLTLFSTPFFAAVPAVARRHSLLGRALLPLLGTANTVLCVKALGPQSGVEVFLFPCILLAGLLFRPHERVTMLAVLAVPFAAYFFVDPYLGSPVQTFTTEEYASMISVHGFSVATLIAFTALMFGSQRADLKN